MNRLINDISFLLLYKGEDLHVARTAWMRIFIQSNHTGETLWKLTCSGEVEWLINIPREGRNVAISKNGLPEVLIYQNQFKVDHNW